MVTAVVTGASRGLGLALARGLLASKPPVRVVLTARDAEAACVTADALRRDLFGSGSSDLLEVYKAPLDLSDGQSVDNFACFAESKLGGVDLLLNNAAVCPEGWNRAAVRCCFRTNVIGPLMLSRALLPGMLRRGRGHIVNISSGDGELVYLSADLQHALRDAQSERDVLRTLAEAMPPRDAFGPSPAHGSTPAYSASKAAMNAITRISASRLPPSDVCGVRLSAVCPGDVQTRMLDRSDEMACRNAIPPETAARDVVWLATAGLSAETALPSGHFWRHRQRISW